MNVSLFFRIRSILFFSSEFIILQRLLKSFLMVRVYMTKALFSPEQFFEVYMFMYFQKNRGGGGGKAYLDLTQLLALS